MKIVLKDEDLEMSSLDDLKKMIPSDMSGKPLNYGQGEGQFRIGASVWGIYVNRSNQYYLQYEEGSMSLCDFISLLDKITAHLDAMGIVYCIEGLHEGDPDV